MKIPDIVQEWSLRLCPKVGHIVKLQLSVRNRLLHIIDPLSWLPEDMQIYLNSCGMYSINVRLNLHPESDNIDDTHQVIFRFFYKSEAVAFKLMST